jgi:nucleolin
MNAKLFVRNLSWSVVEEDLMGLFSQAGQVVSVKVPVRREDGRSRGFAFVEMSTPEEAQQAIETLNATMLKGREMLVAIQDDARAKQPARQHDQVGPNPHLFIRNIAPMVTEQQLRDLLLPHGELISLKVPVDRETGYARGFAFVEMATTEQAQAVIEHLSGQALDGVTILIHFQDPNRVLKTPVQPTYTNRYATVGAGSDDAYAPYRMQEDFGY